MKIKILHVIQTLETGGLENGVVNICNKIDKKKFIIDILCLRGKGELVNRIVNNAASVYYRENLKGSMIKYIYNAYSLCKLKKYDIIHSHGWGTLIPSFIAGRLTGAKVINGEHGTIYDDTLRRRLLQRLIFSMVDLNLTVSEDLKRELMNRFRIGGDNIKPIINGVDLKKFHPSSKSRKKIREELSLKKENFLIGSVGRLVGVKDYPSIIKAFNDIIKYYNDARLILVGEGDERKKIENLIETYNLKNEIKLLGRRDNINEILNAMDLFILSSKSEGLSNTILEAMACGKTVIATNVGGNPEIISDKKTGLLYDVGDVKKLSEICRELIFDKKQLTTYSDNALKHIQNELSVEKMIKNYEKTYVTLVDN